MEQNSSLGKKSNIITPLDKLNTPLDKLNELNKALMALSKTIVRTDTNDIPLETNDVLSTNIAHSPANLNTSEQPINNNKSLESTLFSKLAKAAFSTGRTSHSREEEFEKAFTDLNELLADPSTVDTDPKHRMFKK